ncbi:MAG: LamG-like jellyroll fold domain-containing protein [Ekhidna sp.]
MFKNRLLVFFTFLLILSCGEDKVEIENLQPSIVDQFFEIKEHSPNGTVVGGVIAEDFNEGQLISYSIVSGNEKGVFRINELNGEIIVENQIKLDIESEPSFELEVEVSDNYKIPESSTAKISIELVNVSPLEKGLIGHFPLDGNFEDISSLGNHASGDQVLFSEDRNGNEFGAFELVSSRIFSESFITIPYNDQYNFESDNDFSLSLWLMLKPEQLNGRSESVVLNMGRFGDFSGLSFKLRVNNRDSNENLKKNAISLLRFNSTFCGFSGGYSPQQLPTTKNLIVQRWYHVVCTKKDEKVMIYLNGKFIEEKEDLFNDCEYKSESPILVGRDEYGNGFDGFVDNLLIFDRALEYEEVVDIYTN